MRQEQGQIKNVKCLIENKSGEKPTLSVKQGRTSKTKK